MKLYIRQKVFSWTDRFTVRDGDGRDRYTVEGELFSWGKKLHVFDASGREHDYEIRENGRLIVTIHKEWMTWGDCYELDIADARDEIPALAVVLTIDCVMAAAAAAASN